MDTSQLEERIRNAGLKVTPQRINVLNILLKSDHPSANKITGEIRKKYSSVSSGTIYHILDTFVEKGIIRKIPTEGDTMRYDAVLDNHHHLLDKNSNGIKDFFDDELTGMIQNYFDENPIEGFEVSDIKISLMGTIKNNK